MAQAVFWFLAVMAVGAATVCVGARNPVHSALGLITAMLALAGIYTLHGAYFVGAVQVLVYAGAIMVLFLFVIMLLNLGRARDDRRGLLAWVVALAMAAGLGAALLAVRVYSPSVLAREVAPDPGLANPGFLFPGGAEALAAAESRGIVGAVAGPMFESYLVPFEVTSLLLLAAIVGAVVLAKRRI